MLILSPHFPPSTLAGVHRARHLAKHLPAHGWRPIVIRAHERGYTESGDPDLAALVPSSVEQTRTGALPAAFCRRLGVGDIGLRGYFHFQRAIDRLVAAERPDVVFITGSPFYPMLIARHIRRRHGLPVVLDFQDPWVSAHGASYRPGSKAWLAHRLAVALEPVAVRNGAFITSVSDLQNDEMVARYSWLDRGRMAAIAIGGDPDDFAALRARPIAHGRAVLEPDAINFTYVGTFLPRAGPLVARLFAALADLRRRDPGLAARLRLNFVGTSNQPGGQGYRVLPLARAAGVADLVRETPERVPYLEALSLLANSDALLLIGSDEAHYTASKIYPALLSGRPYLSLFHRASSAHRILLDAGGGRAFAFANEDELAALTPDLTEALRILALAADTIGKPRLDAIEPYAARNIAGQFAEIFQSLAGAP